MEVTSCPPPQSWAAQRPVCVVLLPRVWGRGCSGQGDSLSHHKLRLDVWVDFRLPNGVLEVEAQACGLAGATSTPTAAAVTTTSFAAGGPVVRTSGVPPGLPSQALLLQQELEAFHFAACGAVLCLSQTVSGGLAHSDLALALEQGWGCQLFTGGSFGGEVRGW